MSYPLLAALGGGQLGRHALLHLPAVRHDGLQHGDGAGAQRPPLLVSSGDAALKVPLQRQEGVGQAVVAVALLQEHLLPLGLEEQEEEEMLEGGRSGSRSFCERFSDSRNIFVLRQTELTTNYQTLFWQIKRYPTDPGLIPTLGPFVPLCHRNETIKRPKNT